MRIEHIAMWTNDLEGLVEFYCRYFAASAGPVYENPAKGFTSRFVSFADGARLELMSTTSLSPVRIAAGAQRMGLVHLAIGAGSAAQVDALTERLRQDGHTVVDEPRRTGDGYYESVVLDPDGNRIEITV